MPASTGDGQGARHVGGPEEGRTDSWFTLAPEDLPEGRVFPRRVRAVEEEVMVGESCRMQTGRGRAHGVEGNYDNEHTAPIDET